MHDVFVDLLDAYFFQPNTNRLINNEDKPFNRSCGVFLILLLIEIQKNVELK